MADPLGAITWRRLEAGDLPLLGGWLADERVRYWWAHDPSPEAVARDFGPGLRGEEPGEDLLVLLDDEPVGLVQRAALQDYPEDLAPLRLLMDVPAHAVGLDYLIGTERHRGRGLGPAVIAALVKDTWASYPLAPAVIVPVNAANRASWRALEKAGLRRVAEGDMPPDDPSHDHAHVVYRTDRPSAG